MYKLLTGLFILVSLTFPRVVLAVNLEAISQEQVEALKGSFNAGRAPKLSELLEKKDWQCKIFGVRSRLQTYERPQFYTFIVQDNSGTIENIGAQLISSYSAQPREISGKKGVLTDSLRISPGGLLISELSVRNTSRKRPGPFAAIPSNSQLGSTVVAYSSCK